MRILNIAEKPSVAKEISSILSNNQCRRRAGASQYNPIFEFNCNAISQNDVMVVTSIAGHLMTLDFPDTYRNWNVVDPFDLFTAPVEKLVRSDMKVVYKQVQTEARSCDVLCLWLDCDREGENIAFEVIDCVKRVKNQIRAHFSALIPADIWKAVKTLTPPDENQAKAADARQEIDLRIGCAFSRFQTLLLRNSVPEIDSIVSYGPCQFPTLGFVVERYLQRENFQPEPFWFISASIQPSQVDDSGKRPEVKLQWNRNRLFDKLITVTLFSMIEKEKRALVTKVNERVKMRRKPLPLHTVELQKRCAKYLKISSEEVMKICEMLYQKGYISYPRTETAKFPEGTDFTSLIQIQTGNTTWGSYASKLLNPAFFMFPCAGKGDDHAHPPIHPTKLLNKIDCTKMANMNPDRVYAVYEFITRHFLACCSKHAVLAETELEVYIGNEGFTAKGTIVKEKNYLEIYVYEKQGENFLPHFSLHEYVPVLSCFVDEGITTAPQLLSEPELIAMMDKEGIGTDATISEHIATILKRNYAEKNQANRFVPTHIGLALVETYMYLEFPLHKPYLRAHMESECTRICSGHIYYQDVIDNCIHEMMAVYSVIVKKKVEFKDIFIKFMKKTISGSVLNIASVASVIQESFMPCKTCGNDMSLMAQHRGSSIIRFLQCNTCNLTLNLPLNGELVVLSTTCPICSYNVLEITNTSKYKICPFCYSNPSSANQIPVEDLPIGYTLPCFHCNANCPFAKPEETVLCPCYYCHKGMISLMKTRQDPCRYSIKCNNSSCKLSIMINPDLIKEIQIISEHCPRCSSFLNVSIPLLSIAFHSTTQLSSSMSNPYKVCLTAHDEVIRHYGFINNHPVDMSTRPFTATEVNELANHKPQSTHVTEETTVNVSQLAWLAPVSSATKNKLISQSSSLPSSNRSFPHQQASSSVNPSRNPPSQPYPSQPSRNPPQPYPSRNPPSQSYPSRNPPSQSYPPQPSRNPPPQSYSSYNPPPPPPQSYSSSNNNPVVPPSYHPPYPHVSALPASSPSSSTQVKCNCNEPAVLRTTKQGKNCGRQFYCCGKPRESQCSFFAWADDPQLQSNQPSSPSIPFSSVLRTNPPLNSSYSNNQRTCYVCGKPGHFANNCPENKKELHNRKNMRTMPKQQKQRCCGFCHKPGHTKKTCPELKKVNAPSDYVMNGYTDYGEMDDGDMDELGGVYWEA